MKRNEIIPHQKDTFDFSDLLPFLALEVADINIPPSGLYIKNPGIEKIDQLILGLPLKDVNYNIQLVNNLARIDLNQEYENPASHYMEVEYSFPIEPKAVIHSFTAKFGETTIVGKIKEKKEAQEAYEKGLKQGRNVAYGEIDDLSCDILNLRIGNIPPKSKVSINIQYIQELDVVMSTFWKLTLVSHVMPRYLMQKSITQVDHVVKQYNSLKRYKCPKYNWNFTLTINSESPVIFHSSTTHSLVQIPIEKEGGSHLVKLELDNKETIAKDFVFVYCIEAIPKYTLGFDNFSTSVVISFIPQFANIKPTDAYNMMLKDKKPQTNLETVKGQYIFLLDRSGSMSGEPIVNAKKALGFFIKSLPSDCYVNVVSFGSKYKFMFEKSQKYSDTIIKDIEEKVEKFGADFGGTQILAPLQQILNSSPLKNYPKHVFLLTDGGVSDTKSVIKLVESKTAVTRVHTIGIGNGVSESLIKECANKGKGKYVFIKNSEEITGSIVQLLDKSLSSLITDVEIDFDESVVKSIVPNPKQIPFIIENDPLNLYIMFNQKFKQNTDFTLRYRNSEGVEFENKVSIVRNEKRSFDFIHKVVEHKKIMAMYNKRQQKKSLHEDVYMANVKDLKKQIIKDSITYQVLSPLTAFVCVGNSLNDQEYGRFLGDRLESDEEDNRIKYRRSSLARGRGGRGAGKGGVMSPPHYRSANLSSYESQDIGINILRRNTQQQYHFYRFCKPLKDEQVEFFDQQQSNYLRQAISVPKITNVLKHQNFDGSWKATDELLKQVFEPQVLTEFRKIVSAQTENYCITSVIVRWIQTEYKNKPEYLLILKKAKSWLSKEQKVAKIDEKIKENIKKLIVS